MNHILVITCNFPGGVWQLARDWACTSCQSFSTGPELTPVSTRRKTGVETSHWANVGCARCPVLRQYRARKLILCSSNVGWGLVWHRHHVVTQGHYNNIKREREQIKKTFINEDNVIIITTTSLNLNLIINRKSKQLRRVCHYIPSRKWDSESIFRILPNGTKIWKNPLLWFNNTY